MKMTRKAAAVILAAAAAVSFPAAVSAKTVTENGIRYSVTAEGRKPYTGWTNTDGVKKYYKDGKRRAGWCSINGRYYYLLKSGGYASGDYGIGGSVYVFDRNGRYTGRKYAAGERDTVQSAYERLTDFVTVKEGSQYAHDFGGIRMKETQDGYTVYLTDFDRIDFYKGLAGEDEPFEFELTQFSSNYLFKLHAYISEHEDVRDKYGICAWGIGANSVTVELFDGSKADALKEYLIGAGFDGGAFDVSGNDTVIVPC